MVDRRIRREQEHRFREPLYTVDLPQVFGWVHGSQDTVKSGLRLAIKIQESGLCPGLASLYLEKLYRDHPEVMFSLLEAALPIKS